MNHDPGKKNLFDIDDSIFLEGNYLNLYNQL